MEPRVFQFSEKEIERGKKRMLLMGLLLMPIAIAFAIIEGDDPGVPIRIGLFVFTLVTFGAILFVASVLVSQMMRELEIRVTNEAVGRKGGKFIETINDRDLTRIDVQEIKMGKIIGIRLYSPSRQMPIAGFNNMNLLFDEITQHIPEEVEIRRKQTSIDWTHPLVSLLIAIPVMAATLGLFAYVEGLGENIYDFFSALFYLAFGVFVLIYRPISKSVGIRFRKFEIVTSVLGIVYGIFLLASELLWE